MSTIKVITHNGKFHADDVFAMATLSLLLEKEGNVLEVTRTRNPEIINSGDIVVDVGGIHDPTTKRFDHHQTGGAGKRDNGIPYASFGLVWKEYGEKVAGSKAVADKIDERLVSPIDADDNGVPITTPVVENIKPYTFNNFLYSYYPTWEESLDTLDATFLQLVSVAKDLLIREIKNSEAKIKAVALVEDAYKKTQDKRLIILDGFYPWKETILNYAEPLYVVYMSPENNQWHVSAVPVDNSGSFKNRKDFPAAWAGKRDQELAKITGVEDAVFCHNKLFLAVAKSKEGAVQLAKMALEG